MSARSSFGGARGAVLLLTFFGLGAVACAAEPDDPLGDARALFVAAYAAAVGGAPSSDADPPPLRAYPLYPYLERARLTRSLDARGPKGDVDAAVRDFLATHAGEPVTADLRRAWLASLAERRDWAAFEAAYDASAADPPLRCTHVRAEIALGAERARRDALELWLTPERLPGPCEPVFDWLRAEGALPAALVERRVRALLSAGQASFARVIARDLPRERAAPLEQWADLLEKPERSIDALLAAPSAAEGVENEALLAGFAKLARDDPAAALERHERVVALVGPDRAGDYTLALALGLAWDRRASDALAAFARLHDLDDYARAWQARAALWVGDWAQVDRSIAAMSDAQRDEARWRYWAARTAAARDDRARAEALYTALLPTDNYYSANAAARLGKVPTPHPAPLEANDHTIEALASRPDFVRAHELLLCGLRSPAVSEWFAASAKLDTAQRAQAVRLAARWQWHDIAVATATREKVFFDYELLYPRPFGDAVAAAARLTRLDTTLIYGVIRQESLFQTDAVSRAGALGLAQVMPATGRRIAREWNRPVRATAELFDPELNIALGAAHLRELFDRFGQQTVVALAGYNAGERAVERWLPAEPLEADVWIENIPYNETRDYVQRVLWHGVVFGWLEKRPPAGLDAWLARVVPRPASASAEPAG